MSETVVDEEFANFDNPYRYAGYEYIEEVKLYDLNARYYNPEIARFLSADPYYNLGNRVIGLYEINVPNAWSIVQANALYTYCGNAPILSIDLTGFKKVWIRYFVQSHGGTVTPNKKKFLFISYGLESITVKIGDKTKTYTSKDYKIINDLAYIDEERVAADFGTDGVGTAKEFIKEESKNINCYAFAVDCEEALIPGNISGNCLNFFVYNDVNTVAEAVILDLVALGRHARIIDGKDAHILPDERRIALRVGTSCIPNSNQYDFHFMVQNSDGTWSGKQGGNESEPQLTDNPNDYSWDFLDEKNYYDSETVYLAITD